MQPLRCTLISSSRLDPGGQALSQTTIHVSAEPILKPQCAPTVTLTTFLFLTCLVLQLQIFPETHSPDTGAPLVICQEVLGKETGPCPCCRRQRFRREEAGEGGGGGVVAPPLPPPSSPLTETQTGLMFGFAPPCPPPPRGPFFFVTMLSDAPRWQTRSKI